MLEKKKCRGQNKAKKFYGCGQMIPVQYRKFGLCQKCFKEWMVSSKEGGEYIRRNVIPRAKKKVETEKREKDRKLKIKLTDHKNKLQETVNAIVRQIDKGLPCLARGHHPNVIHAGHVFSRGAEPAMRFNLHNIHRQSAQSNHFQNEDGLLRDKLREEYGDDYYEFLQKCRQMDALKITNLEYAEINKVAKKVLKRLKTEDKRYLLAEERISVRNQVNEELGIYPFMFGVFKREV